MRNALFVLLIIQPFIVKLSYKWGFGISVFNELLSIAVLFAFAYKSMQKRTMNGMVLVFLSYIGYMFLLAFYRQIVPLSFLQILIYSQFFFYFFYFQSLTPEEKRTALISFKNIMTVFVIVSLFLAFFEAYDHSSYRRFLGVHSVKRGINYFYLISFFGSGPSLAIFISLYVVLWHYCHYALGVVTKKRHVTMLIIAILIGILSFSRKEVLFIVLFLIFFPYPSRSKINKWIKRGIFAVASFSTLVVYYLAFFESANTRGFSSEYVRWKIVAACYTIFSDYAPLGTGPGTFGSRVSLMMPHIYDEYNIGNDILGWVDQGIKGAIYDAFFFTLTTEIGIGIFILLFFFYKLFEAKTIEDNPYSRFSKNFLIFYVLALGLFTPMLTHSFGFIVMVLVACIISPVKIFKFRRYLKVKRIEE